MKEDTITIEVKAFGITHTAELPDYAQATEFLEACAKMAESIGYSPQLIREGLPAVKENRE